MLDETKQQSEGQLGEQVNDSPKPKGKSDDIANLLVDKASVTDFQHHATLGRQNATRGHKANLIAGHHYLLCQEMLNHKEKGPWFKAEAEAIGTTERTLYTYINLAKADVARDQQPVILQMFQNSTPAEQDVVIRKAMKEAKKMNIDFDSKTEEEASKKAEQAVVEKAEEAKDEAAVAAYEPNSYTITVPDLPQALRTALDKLQTTQNWKVLLRDIRLLLATDLVRFGYATTPSELLNPNPPKDEKSPSQEEKHEDHSA